MKGIARLTDESLSQWRTSAPDGRSDRCLEAVPEETQTWQRKRTPTG